LRHRRDFDLALIRSAPEYLQALSNEHVQAVIVLVDGMFFWERKRIANFAAIGSAMSTIRSGAPPTLDCPSRTGGQCSSLIVPAMGNVVSNVAKEVMRNGQNRTTGTSEITP
jgi:hypothetical protein